ncbi:hypothetical protein [Egicoccus sp. AB-alg2]|uniref:hypothetical protein n=1 Tax=Egicoccus sp. AB-alg2 TaxID=3242693 RepID=UPI00359E4D79
MLTRRIVLAAGTVAAVAATTFLVLGAMASDLEVVESSTADGYQQVSVTFSKPLSAGPADEDGEQEAATGARVAVLDADGQESGDVEVQSFAATGDGTTWEVTLDGPVEPNVTSLRFQGFYVDEDEPAPALTEPVPMTEADLYLLADDLGALPLDLADLQQLPFAGTWLADLRTAASAVTTPLDGDGSRPDGALPAAMEAALLEDPELDLQLPDGHALVDVELTTTSTPRALNDLLAAPLPTRAALAAELDGDELTQRRLAEAIEDVGLTLGFGNRTLRLQFDDTHAAAAVVDEPALPVEELGLLVEEPDLDLTLGLRNGLVVGVTAMADGAGDATTDTRVLDAGTDLAIAVLVDHDDDLAARLGYVDATATGVDADLDVQAPLGLSCPDGAAACELDGVVTAPTFTGGGTLTIDAFEVTDRDTTHTYDVTDGDDPLTITVTASADAVDLAVTHRQAFDDARLIRFDTLASNAVTLAIEGVVQWLDALREDPVAGRAMPLVAGSPLDAVDVAALLGEELDEVVGAVVDAGGDLSAQATARLLCEQGWLDAADCTGVPGLLIEAGDPAQTATDGDTHPTRLVLPLDVTVEHTFPAAAPAEPEAWSDLPLTLDLDLSLVDAVPGLDAGQVPGFDVVLSNVTWDGSSAEVRLAAELVLDLRTDDELQAAFALDGSDRPADATPYRHLPAAGELCQGLVRALNDEGVSVSLLALQRANGWLGSETADASCDAALRATPPTVELPSGGDDEAAGTVTDQRLCAAAAAIWQVPVADFVALNGGTASACASAVRAASGASPQPLQYLPAEPSPVQFGHRVSLRPTGTDLLTVDLDLDGTVEDGDVRLGLLDAVPNGTIELTPALGVALRQPTDDDAFARDPGRIDLIELARHGDDDALEHVIATPTVIGTVHGTVDLDNQVVATARNPVELGVDVSGPLARVADDAAPSADRVAARSDDDLVVAIVLGDWAGLEHLDARAAVDGLAGSLESVAGVLGSAVVAVEVPFTGVGLPDMAAAPAALEDLAAGIRERVPTRLTTVTSALRGAMREAGLDDGPLTVEATDAALEFGLDMSRSVSATYPFSLDLPGLTDLPVPIAPLDGGATLTADASFTWRPTFGLTYQGEDPLERARIRANPSVSARLAADVRGDVNLGPMPVNLRGDLEADPSLTLDLGAFVGGEELTAAALQRALRQPALPAPDAVVTPGGTLAANLSVGPVPSGELALRGSFADLLAGNGLTVERSSIDWGRIELSLETLARGAIQTSRFVGDTLTRSATLGAGLPLVGDALTDAATVGSDLRTLADEVERLWEAADADSAAFVADAEQQLNQTVCAELVGRDCVTLRMLDAQGQPTTIGTATQVRLEVAFGKELTGALPLNGGLAFDGAIDLGLDTELDYTVGYRAGLALVVDIQDGFVVDTIGGSGNLVELYASLDVDDLDEQVRVAGVELAAVRDGSIRLGGALGPQGTGGGFALQLNGGAPLRLVDLANRATPADRLVTPLVDVDMAASLPIVFAGGLDYVPEVHLPIEFGWGPKRYVVTAPFDPRPDMTLTLGTADTPIVVDASSIAEELINPILREIAKHNPVDFGPVRGGLDYTIPTIDQSVRDLVQIGAAGQPGLQLLLALLDLVLIADDLADSGLSGVVGLGHLQVLPTYRSEIELDLAEIEDLLAVLQRLQNIFPAELSRRPSSGTSGGSGGSVGSGSSGGSGGSGTTASGLPSGLIRFPVFDDPIGLVTLATGGEPAQPVSFVEVDPGSVRIAKGGSFERQLFALDVAFLEGSLTVKATGQAGLELTLGFGYDSRGITSGNLLYGLYLIEPKDDRGRPKEVVALFAELGAGIDGNFAIKVAGLNVAEARFRGGGQARLSVGLNLYTDSPVIPPARRTNGRMHLDDVLLVQQGHYLPGVASLFGSGDFAAAANTLCVFRPGVRFTADLGFSAAAYVLGGKVWSGSWQSDWPGFAAGVSCPAVHQAAKLDEGQLVLNAGPDHWQDRLDRMPGRAERFRIRGDAGDVVVSWTGNASTPAEAQFRDLRFDPDEIDEVLVDLGGRDGTVAGAITIEASASALLRGTPVTILGSTGADRIRIDADVTARVVTNGGGSSVQVSAGTNALVVQGGDTVTLAGGDNDVRAGGGRVDYDFLGNWGRTILTQQPHAGGGAYLDFTGATGPIVGDTFFGVGEIRAGSNLLEFNVDGADRLDTTAADGDDITLRGDVPDGFVVRVGGGDGNRIETDVSTRDREIVVEGNPDAEETLVVTGTRAADTFLLRAQPPGDEVTHQPAPEAGQNAAAEHGFVALFDPAGGADTPVERITYDHHVDTLEVHGVAGENEFYLDDVATRTTIRGGDGAGTRGNLFQVGQLFEHTREFDNALANLARPDDEVRTRAVFDQGPMTLGVSHETTIQGGRGNDEFSVYSNVAGLNLLGVSGNNSFVLRAFIADGTVRALGGDGNDVFRYVENAPVDIVGGSGFNTMFVYGTQGSDGFLLDDGLDPDDFDLVDPDDLLDGAEPADAEVGGLAVCSVLVRGVSDGFPEGMPVDRVPGEPGQDGVSCAIDATYRQIHRVVAASTGGRNAIWVRGTSPERVMEAYGGPDGATVLVGDADGRLTGVRGPVTLAGDLGDELGVDFELATREPVALPGEDATVAPDPRRICYAPAPNELVVFGAGETADVTGRLTGDRLEGLGLYPGGEVRTEDGPVPFPPGLRYAEFDHLTLLLGQGSEQLLVEDTATFVRPPYEQYLRRLPDGSRDRTCITVEEGVVTEHDVDDFRDDVTTATPIETVTTVDTGAGDDVVTVRAIAGPTEVVAPAGTNDVVVGSRAAAGTVDVPDGLSTLEGIVDRLRVSGGEDAEGRPVSVHLDASGTRVGPDGLGDVVEVAPGVVRGLGMPGEVVFEDVDLLHVALTDGADVANVTGTTAVTSRLSGLEGDDRVFVSDAADYGLDPGHRVREPGTEPRPRQDDPGVPSPAHLPGTLAAVAGDLDVDAGTGDNLLMVSDLDAASGTGTATSPARLGADHLRGFADGTIHYDAQGTFTGGVTVWTSDEHADHVEVTGARRDGDPTTLDWHLDRPEGGPRTITTLNTGGGDDRVGVAVDAGSDGLLVVNLGDGDDVLDGDDATLGFVAFGGSGDDTITTGAGDDVVFADHGTIRYRDAAGRLVTELGDDRLATRNDGIARRPDEIRTMWEDDGLLDRAGVSALPAPGRNAIQVGDGDDVVFGGLGNDRIEATAGRNALVGDHGRVWRREAPEPVAVRTNDGFLDLVLREQPFVYEVDVFDGQGGAGDVIRGGSDGDVVFGGPGNDVIVGSPGDGTQQHPSGDVIFAGDGDDIVWGGPGDDRIYGGNGRNFVDVKKPTFDAHLTDVVHTGAAWWTADTSWWDAAWTLAPAVDRSPQWGVDNGRDLVYGGRGRDVLQADAGGPGQQEGDRLLNFYGSYNLFLTCEGAYGAGWILRQPSPGIQSALLLLAEADGAWRASDTTSSGWRQLALVTQEHAAENRGQPHADHPGNNATCGVQPPADQSTDTGADDGTSNPGNGNGNPGNGNPGNGNGRGR